MYALFLAVLSSCGNEPEDRPLTILIPVEANTLDPHFASSTLEWSLLMNVFDSLVTRRADMTIGPGLAKHWEVDRSKKTWTFHLRKGVKFSNGEPFDARSVKFTFERMQNKKIRSRTTIPKRIGLERVEIVDEFTIRIHTTRAVATLPIWLVNAFILPPKYYTNTSLKVLSQKPVGTGPYRVVDWMKDDFIRMEANANWWHGEPTIETVVWRPVPEASARIAELEAGSADIIANISPDQGAMLKGNGEEIHLKAIQGGRRIYIGIRQDQGLFSDRRIRLAMNYAVDFGLIAKKILKGYGSRMASIVNKPNRDESIQPYPFDPQKAKSLLSDAGLEDSNGDGVLEFEGKPFRVKLDVPASRYLKGMEISESVAANLKAVGIQVEVNPLEWSIYLSRRNKKKFSPLYFHGFSSAFNEELDLGVLRPDLYANLTAWRNEEFIDLYSRLGKIFSKDERRRISYRMQRIVHEEVPWIFLWNQYDFYGLSPRVEWNPRPDERIYLPAVKMENPK